MNISDLLIALLRAELCNDYNKGVGIPNSIDNETTERLFSLAEKHDLAHFIYEPMKKLDLIKSGTELEKKLQHQQLLAVFRYKRIEHELATLSALFEEAAIPFIPLKGSVIRKYYAKPWMRTSCDIDILVKEEDIEKAVNLISERLSYKVDGNKTIHDIPMYSPGGVHLELHFNITEGMENIDCLLNRVWDFATPKEPEKHEHILSPEFLIFHIIAHMSYHFVNGGCGIRPFMDMYLLKKHLPYNETELENLCKEAKLSEFRRAINILCDTWFGPQEKTKLTERMQSYLILGGVYGTFENKITVDQQKQGGKFKYLFSRIFMPYHQLKKRFPILNRHPWLMPFCHIRRWVGLLFREKHELKHYVDEVKTNSKISKAYSDETALLLKEIGLY